MTDGEMHSRRSVSMNQVWSKPKTYVTDLTARDDGIRLQLRPMLPSLSGPPPFGT